MNSLQLLATKSADIGDGLSLTVVGMSVVFAALIIIGTMLVVLKRLTAQSPEKASPAPKPASNAAASSATASHPNDGLSPEIVAVLIAAATAAVGRQIRLRSIHLATQPTSPHHVWAERGRVRIHQSHRPKGR